jgi:hypothetical protein
VKDFSIELGHWKFLPPVITYLQHLFEGGFDADIVDSGRACPVGIGCGCAD